MDSFVQISYYSLKKIVTLFANKKETVFLWEKLNRRKSFHETSVSFLWCIAYFRDVVMFMGCCACIIVWTCWWFYIACILHLKWGGRAGKSLLRFVCWKVTHPFSCGPAHFSHTTVWIINNVYIYICLPIRTVTAAWITSPLRKKGWSEWIPFDLSSDVCFWRGRFR